MLPRIHTNKQNPQPAWGVAEGLQKTHHVVWVRLMGHLNSIITTWCFFKELENFRCIFLTNYFKSNFDRGYPKYSMGKGMTTHSSILAWRIPWTVCQSIGSQRVGHNWATFTFTFKYSATQSKRKIQQIIRY